MVNIIIGINVHLDDNSRVNRRAPSFDIETVLRSISTESNINKLSKPLYESTKYQRSFIFPQDFKTKNSNPNPKYKTTRNLKEIFIGRCYEYQFKKKISTDNSWDCNNLWKMFSKSFMYKGPCEVESSDYADFLNFIDEDLPKDKVFQVGKYHFKVGKITLEQRPDGRCSNVILLTLNRYLPTGLFCWRIPVQIQ